MKSIKIYSTPTCPYCIEAKEWLKIRDYPYEDINIREFPEKRQEMIDLSGQIQVPVILVDDNVIVGFDTDKLEEFIYGANLTEQPICEDGGDGDRGD